MFSRALGAFCVVLFFAANVISMPLCVSRKPQHSRFGSSSAVTDFVDSIHASALTVVRVVSSPETSEANPPFQLAH
jgi:ABC-type sulfate transport system permease component